MATETTNQRPDIEENYSGAVTSSNLRMDVREGSSVGAAGLLIAAAWSPSRVGASLMRLRSEWDSAEKPPRPTEQAIKALAATYPARVKLADGLEVPALKAATRHANEWHLHELRLLVGKLKTLTEARNQVALQAMKWRIEDPIPTAGAIIKFWLDQTCSACDGLKWKRAAGSPSLSNRMCTACGGTGIANVPRGQDGRKLANFMDDCVSIARRDIKKRLQQYKKAL